MNTTTHKSFPQLYCVVLPKQCHYKPFTGALYATINFGKTNLPQTFTIETVTINNFAIMIDVVTAWRNIAPFPEILMKLCIGVVKYQ